MDRIKELRDVMRKHDIDIYYIPTDDYHSSEFVGDYFKVREYISGFTGSAGTLIVTMNEAGLWTDGRYFLQAEDELKDSGIVLYRAGMECVPTIDEFMLSRLEDNMILGFDGRCMVASSVINLRRKIENCGKVVRIVSDVDLSAEIWQDRPELPGSDAFILDEEYTGESAVSKIERLRDRMSELNVYGHIITTLDDIAWLLNIRANDIEYSPLLLSYLTVTDSKITLYCNQCSVSKISEYLKGINVEIKDYNEIYNDLPKMILISKGRTILADIDKINYLLYKKLFKGKILNMVNPTTKMKAMKNETEVLNEAKAHIKDGSAYVKFLYCFNQNISKGITELDIANKLLEERSKMEGFIEESFEAIVAYGSHGAIVHYSPDEASNIELQDKSFVLIDTGAHYLEGTTDITRTLACGELTKEEKDNYTLVLKGNLALGDAKFLYGLTGANLDILARSALWRKGLDYNHGTGHGVGYLMNVHEGPNNIRWRLGKGKNLSAVIEPGMITSNEPGVYITGKYGIRLENMIVCKEREKNDFGRFMEFETLTIVPFDINAINIDMLDEHEKMLLNDYHKNVNKIISPFLDSKEKEFLDRITRDI